MTTYSEARRLRGESVSRQRMNVKAPDGSLAGHVERIDAHQWRGFVASNPEFIATGYLQDVRRAIIADWQSGGLAK